MIRFPSCMCGGVLRCVCLGVWMLGRGWVGVRNASTNNEEKRREQEKKRGEGRVMHLPLFSLSSRSHFPFLTSHDTRKDRFVNGAPLPDNLRYCTQDFVNLQRERQQRKAPTISFSPPLIAAFHLTPLFCLSASLLSELFWFGVVCALPCWLIHIIHISSNRSSSSSSSSSNYSS